MRGEIYIPPPADTGSDEVKEKLRAIVKSRGLVGAANDTKWEELLTFMRQREGWVPQYRWKRITGDISSQWDTEWTCHLPFPFLSVEWFDMTIRQKIFRGALLAHTIIDHSPWILSKLKEIGFEFDVVENVVRVFGYFPKSYDDLSPIMSHRVG